MKRLTIVVAVAALFLMLLPQAASAGVEGAWNINAKILVKVKIVGYGPPVKERGPASDFFVFHRSGDFSMIDMYGTWTQRGRKFWVYLDESGVEEYFEKFLGDFFDTDVTSEVKKLNFTGKERRRGDIKGKILMKIRLLLHDYDLDVRATAKVNFTGWRAGPAMALSEKPADSSNLLQALEDAVVDAVFLDVLALDE